MELGDHRIDRNRISTQLIMIKVFQVIRLLTFIVFLAYCLGAFWYVMTHHSTTKDD